MERKRFTLEPIFEKQQLVDEALSLIGRSLESSKRPEDIKSCEEYTFADYESYLGDTLPSDQVEEFENHCGSCLACSQGLVEAWEAFCFEREGRENDRLLSKAMDVVDCIDGEKQKTGLFDNLTSDHFGMAIRLTGREIELVETTGTRREAVNAADTREEKHPQLLKEALTVVQEITAQHLLVEVILGMGNDTTHLNLEMSFLDTSTYIFVPNIVVKLSSEHYSGEAISDRKGNVAFSLLLPGQYEAMIQRSGDPVAVLKMIIQSS